MATWYGPTCSTVILVAASTGCATLLGIDEDYQQSPETGGNGGSGATTGSGAGGNGGSTSGSSSTGGNGGSGAGGHGGEASECDGMWEPTLTRGCIDSSGRLYYRTDNITIPDSLETIPDAEVAQGSWSVTIIHFGFGMYQTKLTLQRAQRMGQFEPGLAYVDLSAVRLPEGLCPYEFIKLNHFGDEHSHPLRIGAPRREEVYGQLGYPSNNQEGLMASLPDDNAIYINSLAAAFDESGWYPAAGKAAEEMAKKFPSECKP